MPRNPLSSIAARAKRVTPIALRRFITDHMHDPARIFDAPNGFPARASFGDSEATRSQLSNRFVFHHIPKTAGSAFRRNLEAMIPRREICPGGYSDNELREIPRQQLDAYRLVCGHITIDLINDLLPDAHRLVFLRDPIERAFSHYHNTVHPDRQSAEWKRWAAQRPELAAFQDRVRGLELDAFLELDEPRIRRMTTNLQTRLVVEREFRKEVGNPDCHGFDERILARAKSNLKKYAFVGTQERFDVSLDVFAKTFGLVRRGSYAANVNASKPKNARQSISAESLEILARRNRMDTELHSFAQDLLDDRARALGVSATMLHAEPQEPKSDA